MFGVMNKRNKTLELHEFMCVLVCIVYHTYMVPRESLATIEIYQSSSIFTVQKLLAS